MKKLLQNLLLLGSIFLISFSAAAEYNVSCSPAGFSYEFNVNLQAGPFPTPERDVATITGTSLSGDINIPDYVTVTYHFNKYNTKIKYPIRYIGKNAFKDNTDLTSVNIPESIFSIGSSAFSGCTGLTSITIPNSETGIGASAFAGCTGLTSITIPNSVTEISASTFAGCTGLTSITIPNSVTNIGASAFQGCAGLTSITIPNSVTNIGDNAFAKCLNLANINFNAECNSMGSSNNPVFEECPSLQTLIIGESVKRIPEYAFKCSGLREVTIPEQITYIGNNAFSGCENLAKVNYNAINCTSTVAAFSGNRTSASLKIGDKVTTIPSYIFSYWTGLSEVEIPISVKYIGAATFRNCTGLTEVTIPSSIIRISDNAFQDCSNLTIVNFNAENCTFMGVNENYAVFNNVPLKTVNLGKSVKTIPNHAFYGLSHLEEITIPNSVTSIGDKAFNTCKTINYNAENCYSIGSGTFSSCLTLNIGDAVKTIPDYAFDNLPIKTLLISENVEKIGSFAFSNCENLFTVTCLSSTPPLLANNSFDYCVFRVPQKELYLKTDVWKQFYFVELNENITTKEDCAYSTYNGFMCENKWIIDRQHCENLFLSHPFLKGSSDTRSRTAAIDPKRKQIYIGLSKQIYLADGSTEAAHLIIFDLETGEYKKELVLSLENAPITGLLCANQIGVDDFGNVWFAGYNQTQENPTKIYVIEDFETGACRQVGEWKLPSDEKVNAGRTDYYDVVGDVTGKQANAVAMSAVGNFGSNYNVNGLYRWELAKGATEWTGGFNGKVSATVAETCPETENGWGATSAVVKIVKETDSDFSGSRFYVDGFNTYPTLYDTSLTKLDDFARTNLPHTCSNGITEFKLGNKKFIAYAENDVIKSYTYIYGYRVNICKLGDDGSFDEMEYYWSVPEYGLGNYSNGGIRQHSIENYKVVDKNGKEGVYLLTYACYNGLGLYLIAEEGFDEASIASTEKIEINNIAPNSNAVEIARYDIHGRKLSEPAKGVNIIKMSDGTTRKELVR